MDLRERRGVCENCEWHLPKQEWCLAKGTVVLNPTEEHTCRFYYLKQAKNTNDTTNTIKEQKK